MNELLLKAIAGDEEAKEQFLLANQGLVYSLVHRFVKGNQVEELFQVGCIGFMKALYQYNPTYEYHFSTYAVPVILGEIKRYFRDHGAIHIPRTLKEGIRIVQKAQEDLQQQGSYTLQDLSEYTNIEMSELILMLEAQQSVASLQAELIQGDHKTTLEAQIADPSCKDITLSLSLHQELAKLSDQERFIMSERYEKGTRQEDIAAMLHISQVQVSRLEKKILLKLRQALK